MMGKRSVKPNGPKVTLTRQKRGWTQEDFAVKAGVDKRTIENIECGKQILLSTLDAIATAFGLPLEEFLAPETLELATSSPTDAPSGTMKDLITGFEGFIEDRTAGFVGRDFVFARIDEFLRDATCPSGYFILQGEPGIGKSAFIAQLVKTTGCLFHFNIELQDINTYPQFLTNIHAQLLARFNLPAAQLPEGASENGLFFTKTLESIGRRLSFGERLVIAIDALDEVESPVRSSAANVLYLPPSLPKGIFIVATTRRRDDLRLHVLRATPFDLDEASPENLEDVAKYIRGRLPDASIRAWIKARGVDEEGLCITLRDKSAGNFMYLHYVLQDIASGEFKDEAIDSLPGGLRAYYQRHWEKMRRRNAALFESLYEPVVCMLAAAERAPTLSQLANWTKQEPQQVQRVLQEWKEFLYVEKTGTQEHRFRPYHATFRKFLTEQVDPGLHRSRRMILESGQSKVRRRKQE